LCAAMARGKPGAGAARVGACMHSGACGALCASAHAAAAGRRQGHARTHPRRPHTGGPPPVCVAAAAHGSTPLLPAQPAACPLLCCQ
jgi:hypothetical protein